MKRITKLLALAAGASALGGCGGGDKPLSSLGSSASTSISGGAEHTVSFGQLTYRSVSGTAQPPVSAAGSGSTVTLITGGIVSPLDINITNPTLASSSIAYVSNRTGSGQLHIMAADGTNQSRAVFDNAENYSPSWAPDGRIAFISHRNNSSHVYILNSDGTQTQVTKGTGTESSVAFSPDGTKIAFDSNRGFGNLFQIYIANADGSNPTQMTNENQAATSPAWSPDGSQIGYTSQQGSQYQIVTINSTSGAVINRFPTNGTSDSSASWSPDGNQMVFRSTRSGGVWQVWKMKADGSNLKQLTNTAGSGAYLVNGAWSPDGSKICYWSSKNGQVWTMNADGSNQTQLFSSTYSEIYPAWSPMIKQRKLIGAGGALGPVAAGFLFGQSGDNLTSVVAFNATTPQTALGSALTGIAPGIPNIVFDIRADKLTKLSFINGISQSPITIIGGNASVPSATGAVVTYNASNGRVSAVLPYTAMRSAASSAPALENGRLRGHFIGVWNSTGQNSAPMGASEVRIDPQTGEVSQIK